MALNATTLSAAMRAAMLADPDIGAIDGDALTALCDAIASTVVAHVTANAVVLPGTFSNSGGPVVGAGIVT